MKRFFDEIDRSAEAQKAKSDATELARLRTAIEELAEGYEKSPHVYTNTLSISYHLRAILKGE